MALTAATVTCLLALVGGLVWARRRRRTMGASILGPSLALAGAAVCLVALETVPRLLVEGEVDACGLEDLDVRLSTTPLAWQAATGGFRSEVRVPADVVTAMVADQLAEGTLVGALRVSAAPLRDSDRRRIRHAWC